MSSKINTILGIFVARVTHRSLVQASLWLFWYSSLPTLAIGAAVTIAIRHLSPDIAETLGTGAGQRNLALFPALIFNPLVESILLASALAVGVKLQAGKFAVIASALLLAVLHSLQNTVWGITVFSFFLIQSYALFYIFKSGFMRSCIVAAVAHAMHNAWILAVLLTLDRLR